MRFCVSANSTAIPLPNPHSSSLAAHPLSQREVLCRTFLLQQSDNLCLLLEYCVQSWGAQISCATTNSAFLVSNPIAEGRGLPQTSTKTCICWAQLPRLARALADQLTRKRVNVTGEWIGTAGVALPAPGATANS